MATAADIKVVTVGVVGPAGAGVGTHESTANPVNHIRIVTSGTRPTGLGASDEGVVIYETDTGLVYLWDGSAWQEWNISTINKFHGAQAGRSAVQTLTSGVATFVNWDTEAYDTDAYHDNVTTNTRITIPSGKGGLYRILASLAFAPNATGFRLIELMKNGVTRLAYASYTPQAGLDCAGPVEKTVSLAATDYIEVRATQSSGGNLNIQGPSDATYFQVERVGA
jgi:hypothetical protein